MRKVVMSNWISLDGCYASADGTMSWVVQDPQVDRAAHELMRPDTGLFGRVTYQMLAGYWPGVGADPEAPAEARAMADELRRMTKVVFSTTMPEAGWENSRLVRGDVGETVAELKRQNGDDIVIFGSGTIVRQLAAHGLIDEYLFLVTPIVLGDGKPLLHGTGRLDLGLLEARKFDSGNVLLRYRFDK